MTPNLLALAREHMEYARLVRRELHRFPEVGTDLPRTRALVLGELGKLGLAVRENVGGGIVADVDGPQGSPRIALRADMDALPMQEESGLEFASQIPGQSHMCGHDAHTAMLLGAARMMTSRPAMLKNHVRLLFQPNEEFQPGGARAMVQAGCLDKVDRVYGLHVWPGQPTGWFGTRPGPLMARPDVFSITVTGRGGHASAPHHCIDPILAASQLVTQLQTIVSRRVAPGEQAVLSVTRFEAGSSYNIIPDTAFLQGTVRTLSENAGELIEEEMHKIASGLALGMNVSVKLEYQRGYPVVVNDASCAARAADVLRGISDTVDGGIDPVMAGEDFSYYLQKVPGCFIFMGCGPCGSDGRGGLHGACFRLDEDCLPWGMAALAGLAMQYQQPPDRI